MRKQFDLEYYLKHPDVKVVTRNGNSARILCTDKKDDDGFCVVAAVTDEDCQEWVDSFSPDGNIYYSRSKSDYDLFFDLPDPEKKRVPLTYEDLLDRVKAGKTMWIFASSNICEEIVFFTTDTVDTGNRSTVYEFLKDTEFHFADGTPCWKEVEE